MQVVPWKRGASAPRQALLEELGRTQRLRTAFSVLCLRARVRKRVPAHDQQPNQHRADQHDNSYIEPGVKCLIACRGSDQP